MNAAKENVCTTQVAADVPLWFREFKCVTIRKDGDQVLIRTRDVPPHPSYYFGAESALFASLPDGKRGNPNRIVEQDYELRIPLTPRAAPATTPTSLDAIGVAVNGVLLFNNQAAPGDDLLEEIQSFDQANGHPTPSGTYHYHIEPVLISNNDAKLVGVLLDGFPVYGKKDEDGSVPKLDSAHGHTHATRLFPSGVYHYHVTDSDPYIAAVYHGTPGSLRR